MNITKNKIPLIAGGAAILVILIAVLIAVSTGSGSGSLAGQLTLGERYLAEFDYESAILAYQKAIEIDPKSADAYIGLANAYMAQRRYDEAIAILKQGIDAAGDARLSELLAMLEIPDPDWSAALEIKDEALEAALRAAVNKPSGTLTVGDFKDSTELLLNGKGITDVSGLGALTHLTRLELTRNEITDISPLAPLKRLTYFRIDENQISDISVIAGMPRMGELYIYENKITTLEPLRGLSLTGFSCSYNRITDLSPIAGSTKMTWIIAGENPITDVSPLKGLTKLIYISIWNAEIDDISALKPLTGLTTLRLYNTNISDISALADMTAMEKLYLQDNAITDISPLAGMTKLVELNLSGNPIEDWSPIDHVTIHVDGRPGDGTPLNIKDPALEEALRSTINKRSGTLYAEDFSQITLLNLSNANIEDLSGLEALTWLERLYLKTIPKGGIGHFEEVTGAKVFVSAGGANVTLPDGAPTENVYIQVSEVR